MIRIAILMMVWITLSSAMAMASLPLPVPPAGLLGVDGFEWIFFCWFLG